MAFFDGFFYTLPTHKFTATLIFVKIKGVEVVHIFFFFLLFYLESDYIIRSLPNGS